MEKPHLFKRGGYWYCMGSLVWGIGWHYKIAYANWKNQMRVSA